MAMLEDVLGLYDQSNFDIRSTAALIRQLGQQAGLSEEELAAAVPVFGDYHKSVYNSGYTEGSNYSAIAQRAVSDALAARGADPSRFNQATQGFVDQGAQQAQQRWQATQKPDGGLLGDLGPIAKIAALFPGPQQPFLLAANAANSLSQGDLIGAGTNALGAYNGFSGGYNPGAGGENALSAREFAANAGVGANPTIPSYMQPTAGGVADTGFGANTGGTMDGYDLGGGLTVDQYGNVTGGTGINTGGSVEPFSFNSTPVEKQIGFDPNNIAGQATYGESMSSALRNPFGLGAEGTGFASQLSGAAGGEVGAGTASGLGMLQKLMAATGLSEKQLMGLGAAGISSLTSLYGASQIGKAATTAANIGSGAADRATQLQREQYDQTRADLAPYRTAGTNALARLTAGTAPGGEFTKQFGMSDFEQDPGYGFRMSEGLKALDRSAAARGNLLSGSTLKGAQRYAQDLGSQEYQNAFNRYQTNRSNLINPIQSLAGVGQTSTNQGIAAGQNFATNVGNLGMNAAGNQANAGLTAAQANQSAYGNVGNAFANYLAPNPMNTFFQNQLNRQLPG